MRKDFQKKNVNNFFKVFISFFLLSFTVTATNITAWGAEAEGESSSIGGFTYSLEFPENQLNPNLGYYQLMMTPGQEQSLAVILSNPGSEAITVNLALNGAKTNKTGVIEYANRDIENDASLAFAFEDLVTGPESVELAAGETKQVTLTVKMPETSFEGVIAGGLQMMKAGQTEDADSSGGSKVVNQYAYVVSILLQESDTELVPDLQFNRAYGGQLNYRNSVYINFSNVIAAYLNDLTVEAQVMKKDSNTVLYEAKKTSMRMAPNSFMEFPVSMNGERMEAGSYTTHVLATSGEQRWEWTEDFEITEDEAQKYNERDVGLTQETGINWQLIALIVGGFVAAVVVIFGLITLFRKKKQRDMQTAKGTQKKQPSKNSHTGTLKKKRR
ncbi:DUF916 and DUF3324 domain-containing protein [Enterococcus sp. BWT-B8]|uniref:DUF916 and DUF3324 domain-containing protein n=1 Tax=unclassified Enterococcus TaxID=2608891 RepID=UPI001E43396F|nr:MULTISPECIES: DUF916 and DUF3324 domain-containing protein [unclassified Enterococcus]MCB5951482.1 DUF916 and DUF3324 domain-containing protein [Enterococcus sp. BWT-B8]MCB5955041.1 DUF916 and DUF3324 domain-containing protein [Enterococcus sp. CWB-B31]